MGNDAPDEIKRLVGQHWTAIVRERDDGDLDLALKNTGTDRDDPDAEWVRDVVAMSWYTPSRWDRVETISAGEVPNNAREVMADGW